MDRYDVSVRLLAYDTVDPAATLELGSAISRPITITNGRQDLNSSIGQTYASFSFIKEKLFSLIEAEGLSRSSVTFGSYFDIRVRTEGSVGAYERLFRGNITDMSSDAYEITFSLVHEIMYACSGVSQASLVGPLNEPLSSTLTYAFTQTLGTTPYVFSVSSALDVYTEQSAVEIQNPLPYLEPIIQQAASVWMFTDIDANKLRVVQRPPTGIVTPVPLQSEDIFLDYSIDRSVNEVCNYVDVVYDGGTYTAKNQTSINKIGERYQQVSTQLTDYPDVVALAFWVLGAKAPAGYPVISFRTTAELLDLTAEQVALQIVPNQKLDLTLIGAEGFDDYAYIEQVRHTIDRAQWRLDLVISNADYSELTQTWAEVAPSTEWQDVRNNPNDFISWDDCLYTSL